MPCGSRRHPTFLRLHPRRSPRGGLHGACSPWARSSRPSASPPCRGVPGGGSAARFRHPSCPLASVLGGCGRWGRGGGAPLLPFLRRRHVAGTVLARGTALVLLLGCGARHVALVFALPTLRAPPRCPPRWRGGAAARPSLPATPTLGGAEACGGGGGGGACRFLPLPSRRRHEAWPPSLCRGGGVCLAAPFVAPSILRPHPRWSPRRGLPGARPLRARSCGSSRTLLPLPPHPAALPSAGGGALFAPPLPAFALGGAVVLGGGRGALSAFPPLHARRRHVVGTTQPRGKALGCCGGGGGFPCGLSRPAPWYPAPHSRITSRCCPLGGSRHVSAWCSVSRACSLLCPYLLEEVRTRVDSEDEEVRAAGRTYRTPRRLLAPSAALVEGRAPVSAPNSPGGADRPSSPWCLCIHFRAA